MAFTAANAIERARITFPEMDAPTALLLLNDEWAELCNRYPLRDDELWQALTEDDREQALTENAVQVQKACFYTDAINFHPLSICNEQEKDRMDPSWRDRTSGTPSSYYLGSEISGDTGILTIGYDALPNQTTLAVSGATNATPIVLTTTTAHGLEDGMAVRPFNVGGNTAANVLGYAMVTGYSTTTFALYSDSDLTLPVAGNGAYTSGGHVAAPSSPAVRLFIRRNSTWDATDNLPNMFPNTDVFTEAICLRWAKRVHPADIVERCNAIYIDALHRWDLFKSERTEGRGVTIKPYHYRTRRAI